MRIISIGDEPGAKVQPAGNPARESGSALSSPQAPHDQEITALPKVIGDLRKNCLDYYRYNHQSGHLDTARD
jgi:hypothetical protein